MEKRDHIQIVHIFLTITEWEKTVEQSRQFLNSIPEFEPYAAFLRLSNNSGNTISAQDISKFLEENAVRVNYLALKSVISIFDTKMREKLDFEDFLKMVLSRESPELRFNAVSNPNYDVDYGEKLTEEIEFTLSRFFERTCKFLENVSKDTNIRQIYGKLMPQEGSLTPKNSRDDQFYAPKRPQKIQKKIDLFGLIDEENRALIDFGSLKMFLGISRIQFGDGQIISILRALDIDDDGKIDKTDFDFFLTLFRVNEPSPALTEKLQDKALRVPRQQTIQGLHSETNMTLPGGCFDTDVMELSEDPGHQGTSQELLHQAGNSDQTGSQGRRSIIVLSSEKKGKRRERFHPYEEEDEDSRCMERMEPESSLGNIDLKNRGTRSGERNPGVGRRERLQETLGENSYESGIGMGGMNASEDDETVYKPLNCENGFRDVERGLGFNGGPRQVDGGARRERRYRCGQDIENLAYSTFEDMTVPVGQLGVNELAMRAGEGGDERFLRQRHIHQTNGPDEDDQYARMGDYRRTSGNGFEEPRNELGGVSGHPGGGGYQKENDILNANNINGRNLPQNENLQNHQNLEKRSPRQHKNHRKGSMEHPDLNYNTPETYAGYHPPRKNLDRKKTQKSNFRASNTLNLPNSHLNHINHHHAHPESIIHKTNFFSDASNSGRSQKQLNGSPDLISGLFDEDTSPCLDIAYNGDSMARNTLKRVKSEPHVEQFMRKDSPKKILSGLDSNPKKAVRTHHGVYKVVRTQIQRSEAAPKLTKIIPIFVDIINIEKAAEFSKQELSLRPDFNIRDLFKLLDSQKRGGVNFNEFNKFLRMLDLGVGDQSLVSGLFERFDADQDLLLSLEELTEMLAPDKKQYRLLLNCRQARLGDGHQKSFFEVRTQKWLDFTNFSVFG